MKNQRIKKIVSTAFLIALALTGGIATAHYSGFAAKVQNDVGVVSGSHEQEDAGTLLEPAWEASGKELAAKGLRLGQIVKKDPYIVSNADWSAWAFMKVDIPVFADGANAGKDTVTLLNVSDNWQLLSDSTIDNIHSLIYGYKTRLAGGNSAKAEAERAKTDSLFDSFKPADDISVDQAYIGSLNVYGTLVQSEGSSDLLEILKNVSFDGAAASEGVYKINYSLDGGTLSDAKYLYTKNDYGYAPPAPVKEGYTFTGWTPESIPADSTGNITFTANWKAASATFDNTKLKTKIQDNKSTLDSFVRASEAPSADIMVADNLVSTSDSGNPIYAWADEDGATISWYSEAEKPMLGEDCSEMFSNCSYLTDISGLSTWDTRNVTNMKCMFGDPDYNVIAEGHESAYGCDFTDVSALSSWNTENVTNMSGLFAGCNMLRDISALSSWNTTNVTDMSFTFAACMELIDDTSALSSWDTGKVTDMSGMFFNCHIGDISPLINWNTGNVTNMHGMFFNSYNIEDLSPLANWNVGNVTNMQDMFYGIGTGTGEDGVDGHVTALNDWDILNVENFTHMFMNSGFSPCYPTFTKRAGTWDADGTFTPAQPKDPELTADKDIVYMFLGNTGYDMFSNIYYSGDGILTYESSKPSVATVSDDGGIKAISPGTATITISASKTANYNAASIQIQVNVQRLPGGSGTGKLP